MPTSDLDSLARDCLRFTMHFFQLIQQSAQHIYNSALPLSPESSVFSSMSLATRTRIIKFHDRPNDWGCVVRTITGTPGVFTCMTAIGCGSTASIAAACDDDTVRIYDAFTGVLRLSLRPPYPIQAIAGSSDGSILCCTHRESPSITLWDIQTGGCVHTFTLETDVKETAISLNGRYLACSLSNGAATVWEVGKGVRYPVSENSSPVTCLCWLTPEEWFMIVSGGSIHIQDIVTGRIVPHLKMWNPILSIVASQKRDQFAVLTSSGADSTIIIIHTETGAISALCDFRRQLSCFAFSQNTAQIVYGTETRGLGLMEVSTNRWTHFDLQAMATSILTLSSGITVANITGSGIQFLSLDKGYALPQRFIPPALVIHPVEGSRVIAVVPTSRDRIILLETSTMSHVLTISTQKNLPVSADRPVILCASLQHDVAARCFTEGNKEYLQLWEVSSQNPQWTVQINEPPSIGRFSPACTRLVTFHNDSLSHARVWDALNGHLVAYLGDWRAPRPLDVGFDSEDRFHAHYDAGRASYTVTPSNHLIMDYDEVPSGIPGLQTRYRVDDGHEWVLSGSQRVCWIPTGYIGSTQVSHWWDGFSLVMAGQDGILRKLTFCDD